MRSALEYDIPDEQINGKEEVMKEIFPLVQKYGGVVVGLTLDEAGIPATAEGRLAIAEKIYRTAESYGIERKNIVIDALTMTMSTDDTSAGTTLEVVKKIKEQGGRTVLGVSNISFGLPHREILNAAFFSMAMSAGLSAGIINPNVASMRQAYRGTKEALASGRDTMDVINGELIPALDIVGQAFEKGTMFLPQLLMSAEAAKAGFAAIREYVESTGTRQEKKGTVVIATVKGDIHDIGKNIVKVLLENYGFDVIDLGKDVPPETVVEAVQQSGARLVGLSAVLTKEYADMIGADYYARDAMQSVHYAEKISGDNDVPALT